MTMILESLILCVGFPQFAKNNVDHNHIIDRDKSVGEASWMLAIKDNMAVYT